MSDDKLFDEFRKLVLNSPNAEDDPPPNDDEALKDALLKQNRDERFGADGRSDDEVWQAAMKDEQFKAALRGEGGRDAR